MNLPSAVSPDASSPCDARLQDVVFAEDALNEQRRNMGPQVRQRSRVRGRQLPRPQRRDDRPQRSLGGLHNRDGTLRNGAASLLLKASRRLKPDSPKYPPSLRVNEYADSDILDLTWDCGRSQVSPRCYTGQGTGGHEDEPQASASGCGDEVREHGNLAVEDTAEHAETGFDMRSRGQALWLAHSSAMSDVMPGAQASTQLSTKCLSTSTRMRAASRCSTSGAKNSTVYRQAACDTERTGVNLKACFVLRKVSEKGSQSTNWPRNSPGRA